MMGLKDITAKEFKAEFDQLDLRSSNLQDTVLQQLPGEIPPTAQLHEVYNLKEIGAIQKGVTPQSTTEEPTIHNWAEQLGTWDPADIL
jgi:hypothetical protein